MKYNVSNKINTHLMMNHILFKPLNAVNSVTILYYG